MFVSNLTSDSDYFLAGKNFVSLVYTGTSIIYRFTLYGRLTQALIDGNDEIKVQMIQRTDPRIDYFTGTSKEEIEVSNLGFVQNAKKQLQRAVSTSLIREKSVELINILPDDIVSGIGSKTINDKNYFEFLPKIEQIDIQNRTSRARPKAKEQSQVESFAKITRKLFDDTGIYPGRIADVNFPGEKLSEFSDGLDFGANTSATKQLLDNTMFNDYYTKYYVKNTNTKIKQSFTNATAEYQKFTVDIEMAVEEDYDPISDLVAYKDLSARVVLLKKDIEVSSKVLRFQNAILFQEATSGAKKIETRISVPEAKEVLPDRISVTNRESYAVEVSVFEFISAGTSIKKNRLGVTTLLENETLDLAGSTIYFDQSESRAYAVTANKAMPGIQGVSNVIDILSPPETSTPPRSNPKFSLNIVPQGTPTIAKIQVSGLTNSDQSALVYKRKIGETDKTLLGRVNFGTTSISDDDIQLGDTFVYTADLQLNGASAGASAMTGFVSQKPGDTSGLSFSIVDKKTVGRGRNVSHTFKIVEDVATTTAAALLDSANETGQSSVYSDEINSEKQDSTIVTRYFIIRIRRISAVVEFLGIFVAGKVLRFPLRNASDDPDGEKYEYVVMPQASSLAALSYRTVVEEVDATSGNAYKIRYKKWRDKNYERSEVLPTTTTVLKNDLANIFFNIPPSVGEAVEFTRRNDNGRIVGVRAVSKENSDCAFLSWRFTGDIENVLHFVVFANYNGTKAPIGLAIPDDVQSRRTPITYCDDELGSVSGEVIYSVMPVFTTGQEGEESRGARVSSTKNYPRGALK